jgi:S1-C subfamily serine protease
VVPGQTASVVTKETTVVIKEENLIIDAVDKNSKSVVRVGLEGLDGEFGSTLGIGVVVSGDGLIVTDSLNLTESNDYLIKTSSGRVHSVSVDDLNLSDGVALLKLNKLEEEESVVKLTKPSFGDTENLRLGQTVIAIGGLSGDTVSTGIVSKLNENIVELPVEGEENQTTIGTLGTIISNIAFSSDYSGGPLIDVDGFLLGINITRKDGDFSVPINSVLDLISKKSENVEEVVE